MRVTIMWTILLILILGSVEILSCKYDFKHPHYLPQPENTFPYKIRATSYEYSPGTTITLSISGDTFNSIYVQAIDGDNNEAIGTWRRDLGSVPIDACSAVLHSSYEDSTDSIELKWVSPVDGNGKVVFGVHIVKNLTTFWIIVVRRDLLIKEELKSTNSTTISTT